MDQINNNNEPVEQTKVIDQTEVIESEEPIMSPEQRAEMEAMQNQELHGDHVKKIGDCAVVTVEDETIALECPITYPQLLSAIIKRKYDTNQSEAITANYLAARAGTVPEEKAAEYVSEYETYQSWREKAKAVAKEVMGIEA